MATTRIMPLHVGKGRTESRAISDIIDYVANPQKTDNGRLITGFACDNRSSAGTETCQLTLSVLSPFPGCDATGCHAFLADSWNKAFLSD